MEFIVQTLPLMSCLERDPPPLGGTSVPTANVKVMEAARFGQVTHTYTNRWSQMEARLADESKQSSGCPRTDGGPRNLPRLTIFRRRCQGFLGVEIRHGRSQEEEGAWSYHLRGNLESWMGKEGREAGRGTERRRCRAGGEEGGTATHPSKGKGSQGGFQSPEMMEWSRRRREQWYPIHRDSRILQMMGNRLAGCHLDLIPWPFLALPEEGRG